MQLSVHVCVVDAQSLGLHSHASTQWVSFAPNIVRLTSLLTQDPSYPVYVDSSVMMGMSGEYEEGQVIRLLMNNE